MEMGSKVKTPRAGDPVKKKKAIKTAAQINLSMKLK